MLKWFTKSTGASLKDLDYERGLLRWKYECLRNLLGENSHLLSLMTDIQANYLKGAPVDAYNRQRLLDFSDRVLLMIEGLNILSDNNQQALYQAYLRIESQLFKHITSYKSDNSHPLILPLKTVDRSHLFQVGGKAANLGEIASVLPEKVPPGFIVSTAGYFNMLSQGELGSRLKAILGEVEIARSDRLASYCQQMIEIIDNTPVPQEIDLGIANQVNNTKYAEAAGWAVRSSAVGEDGTFSFAGQFESFLNVLPEDLSAAYRSVIASRFSERAVIYRLQAKLREVDSPMAVLFLPLINASVSGVLYTVNPNGDRANMLISSTWGLAADLVTGKMEADTFIISRTEPFTSIERIIVSKKEKLCVSRVSGLERTPVHSSQQDIPSLRPDELAELARIGLVVEEHFGLPQDIEWLKDSEEKLWILQCRPLVTYQRDSLFDMVLDDVKVLAEGGMTIFPGRASGKVQVVIDENDLCKVTEGSILVVRQATPELVKTLHLVKGVISESGQPTGHAATVIREKRIPAIFGLTGVVEILKDIEEIGLDAIHRKIYLGIPWPKQLNTLKAGARVQADTAIEDPLSQTVFVLNLYDPQRTNFTAKGCQSMHDIIRYVHEKAVEAVFKIGDKASKRHGQITKKLQTNILLNITVLDLGGAISEETAKKSKITPEEIASVPFQALWRGMNYPGIKWHGRTNISLSGFSSVITSTVASGQSMRRLDDRNYLMVAPEYMNMNARLAYHYAMVDAFVGEHSENNFVNFRFRGGGAQFIRRDLRSKFLTEVLIANNFLVDHRGDLVTAWLRGVKKNVCEEGLELLGRLMGCARQLDMLLDSKDKVYFFVDRFLQKEYEVFA